MKCRWRVEFSITPSLFGPEVIPPYEFIVANNSTTAAVKFETNAFDEVLPGAPDFEYAEETLAKQHANRIRELLLARIIYSGIVERVSVVMKQSPALLNTAELKSAGTPLSRPSQVLGDTLIVIYDGPCSIADTNTFMTTRFTGKSAKYQSDALRAAEWLSQADGLRANPVDSFLAAWISFNGLCCAFAAAAELTFATEDRKIRAMIDSLGPAVAVQTLQRTETAMTELETYNSHNRSGRENYSERLHQLRASSAPQAEILKYAALAVYGIRNAIVHESLSPLAGDIMGKSRVCSEWVQDVTPLLLGAFSAF